MYINSQTNRLRIIIIDRIKVFKEKVPNKNSIFIWIFFFIISSQLYWAARHLTFINWCSIISIFYKSYELLLKYVISKFELEWA